MTAVFKTTKFKNKKRSNTSQVSKHCLDRLFLKQGLSEEKKPSFPLEISQSAVSPKNRMRPLKNSWLKHTLNYSGHVGHKHVKLSLSRAWLPPIGDYLIGNRNSLATFNSHLVLEGAVKGLYLSATVLQRRGHILVVDTRGEASPLPNLIENSNHRIPASLSFSGPCWVGGSLTNWESISVMVRRCAQISKQFDVFITQNRIHIPRYEKMMNAFPGFIKVSLPFFASTMHGQGLYSQSRPCIVDAKKGFDGHPWPCIKDAKKGFDGHPWPTKGQPPNLFKEGELNSYEPQLRFKRRPDLLWILNPNENRHIIEEAKRLSIPTIGIVDSNTDLSNITVSIPVNVNASFWPNKLITTLITLSKSMAMASSNVIVKR